MKRLVFAGFMVLSLGIAVPVSVPTIQAQESNPVQSVVFAASDANFPNPERGFHQQLYPFWLGTQRQPLIASEIRRFRDMGISMVRAYYVIDEFKDGPISTTALDAIGMDLVAVRQAGLKIVPRFTYVFPCVGSSEPCNVNASTAPDAPLERVLAHIDQLAPVLRAHGDVIAFMEMGFVGPWGEWHSSSNELVNANNTANDSSRAIIERILWALPETRMAALRYPHVKQQLFGPTPLPPEEAFTGSPRARLGFHNDCFLASNTSGNTYANPIGQTTPAYIESQKALINQENRFLPQGGETCSSAPGAQQYIQCPNALRDLTTERWSMLSVNYQKEVLELWLQQGCFDEIHKRLGYRLRLVSAEVPSAVRAGGIVSVKFTIANDGFAAPYNPRAALLVLRHSQSGRVFVFPIPEDPRRWGAGETRVVTVDGILPTEAESGDYQVLLKFPDPEPTLYSRPEYAIRLANDGLWEEATGSNVLPTRIAVSR